MTPEWFSIIGLFVVIWSKEYEKRFDKSGSPRHLYAWTVLSFIGAGMFLVGVFQAMSR